MKKLLALTLCTLLNISSYKGASLQQEAGEAKTQKQEEGLRKITLLGTSFITPRIEKQKPYRAGNYREVTWKEKEGNMIVHYRIIEATGDNEIDVVEKWLELYPPQPKTDWVKDATWYRAAMINARSDITDSLSAEEYRDFIKHQEKYEYYLLRELLGGEMPTRASLSDKWSWENTYQKWFTACYSSKEK